MLQDRRVRSAVRSAAPARRHAPAAPPPHQHRLLVLQRQAGNRAVSGSVLAVQRHYTEHPEEFIEWITNHNDFREYSQNPLERCHDSALAMEELMGTTIPYEVRVFVTWGNAEQRVPEDHVVVVATVGGATIVVDPTGGQFEGLNAGARREAEWQQDFLAAFRTSGVAVRTFTKVAAANRFAEESLVGTWDSDNLGGFQLNLLQGLPQQQGDQQQQGGQQQANNNRCCTIL